MPISELTDEQYLKQLEAKYGERRQTEFKKESATVLKYFKTVSERLKTQYVINRVLAVGGTGVVHTGSHIRFHQPVVVKINRPNVDAEQTPMVDKEAKVLPTLNHPNIIRVFDIGEDDNFSPKLTYIVEPLIEGASPFFTPDKDRAADTWLLRKVNGIKASMPPTSGFQTADGTGQTISALTSLLREVATIFSQWVDLLAHLHSKHENADSGYIYLDVKPENVLVDDHLHLTSIDYGSVEYLEHTDLSPVQVFFTERYAHPTLIKRKIHKPSSNRVTGSFKRLELSPAFDYYALGVSMLEVLNEIALIRPHVVPQLPLYRSLHFLATRLLDGRNLTHSDNEYLYASQIFPSLRESDYKSLAYGNLAEVYRDLDKERGRWILETEVPELAAYSKDIVRVVPGFNTVLTPRLRGVMEHPLVARLKLATQLGLVSLVYPTADHSRYDHALGSYTYTTFYVKSLFNDLGNPLFRNLVGREDINAVLLAALLHDLGQYPLAHDLEEVHDGIFHHGRIGMELLLDTTTDERGRTLLQIIEDPENGWGVGSDSLRRILGTSSKSLAVVEENKTASLKTNVLAAIIDGQVDADKADYIIRDSARCELPYGSQLDIERLLRVLTVAILPEETSPERRVSLGVYDKGLVSAHAFGLARYELLSTVYWHHTARVLKCTLQYATASGLPLSVFGPQSAPNEGKQLELRHRLLAFIKQLVPPFNSEGQTAAQITVTETLDLAAEPPEQVIDAVENEEQDANASNNSGDVHWYPGIAWTDWLMLEWIADLPNANTQSRNLIAGIQSRRLYKRVATFDRKGPYSDLVGKLDSLTWPQRVETCKRLHDKVHARLKYDWARVTTVKTMDEDEFEQLSATHLLVLIDIPNPTKKTGYNKPLGVVPELKEKLYHQNVRQASEDTAWREIMVNMVIGCAPVRILCHPDIRNLVNAVYANNAAQNQTPVEREVEKDVSDAIAEALERARK